MRRALCPFMPLHFKSFEHVCSEGRECGVGSAVVGFRVFGAPPFSVQRSPEL